MEIVIEKSSAPSKTETGIRWILDKMEVGDSFLVDLEKANSIRNIAAMNFHRHTSKFFRSTVKGQPKGKIRFWRDK